MTRRAPIEHDDDRPEQLPEPDAHDAERVQQQAGQPTTIITIAGKLRPVSRLSNTIHAAERDEHDRPESKAHGRVDELQPVEREQGAKKNQTDADDELRRQVESRVGWHVSLSGRNLTTGC